MQRVVHLSRDSQRTGLRQRILTEAHLITTQNLTKSMESSWEFRVPIFHCKSRREDSATAVAMFQKSKKKTADSKTFQKSKRSRLAKVATARTSFIFGVFSEDTRKTPIESFAARGIFRQDEFIREAFLFPERKAEKFRGTLVEFSATRPARKHVGHVERNLAVLANDFCTLLKTSFNCSHCGPVVQRVVSHPPTSDKLSGYHTDFCFHVINSADRTSTPIRNHSIQKVVKTSRCVDSFQNFLFASLIACPSLSPTMFSSLSVINS